MTAASLGAVDRLNALIALVRSMDSVSNETFTGEILTELEAIAALTPAAGALSKDSAVWTSLDIILTSAQVIKPIRPLVAADIIGHIQQIVAALEPLTEAAPAPPPADAVRALVGKWREEAAQHAAHWRNKEWAEWVREAHIARASELNRCADELERALSAAPTRDHEAEAWLAAQPKLEPAAAPTPEAYPAKFDRHGSETTDGADLLAPTPEGDQCRLSVQRSIAPDDRWHWTVTMPDGHLFDVGPKPKRGPTSLDEAMADMATAGLAALEKADSFWRGKSATQQECGR